MTGEVFMTENYSVIEPGGSNGAESKLERLWGSFSGCYGIRNTRITQFDPYAAMSSQPIKYSFIPFSIDDTLPSLEWVKNNLKGFIHEENYTSVHQEESLSDLPTVEETIEIPDEDLQSFLNQSEWENSVQLELPKGDTVIALAESIYAILCHPQIGSSKNTRNVNKAKFCEQIIPLLNTRQRLLFVLPGCPFKDQNRFRVPHSADSVDYGEISFLIRLHNMIQALYQIHPYGGQAIILSDGSLYQDIFHIPLSDVNNYKWKLTDYRNKLNLYGDVSVIDLKDMIDRANSEGIITRIQNHIENVIWNYCQLLPQFENLISGMKWNLNSRTLLSELNDHDAWIVITQKRENTPPELQKKWDEYHSVATEAAITYAATNLMLKWTDLIRKFFPDAIRCTVHPKKGQFALAHSYPWNGIAWSRAWPKSISDIQTLPYYKLQDYGSINKVVFRNTKCPCFYTKAHNHSVFDAAQRVLRPDGWNIDDLFGRKFSIYDLPDFYNLGKDDPNFTWARKIVSESYYTTLLDFRINHYKKYGFGVHAVYQGGTLVGQLGLQVLDENSEKLEFVIFLGKDYVRKGIGTKLLRYLFSQCTEAGINKVYGIVRTENDAAKALINKFHGNPMKTLTHYGYTGIMYELKI